MEIRTKNLSAYFTKHHYVKHHKNVRPIYLQTDKIPRIVPLVLLKPALKGCVDTEDSNMEEFRKTSPIPQIAQLRRSRTRTKCRYTTERHKG